MNGFLRAYLRQKKNGMLAFLLCCGIFALCFYLYDLPIAALLYPAGLAGLLLFGFLTADFCKCRKQYRLLQELAKLPGPLMEHFPEEIFPGEEQYRVMIEKLRREQTEDRAELERRYKDRMDYYTLWVHQIKVPIASMDLQLQSTDSDLSRSLSEDLQRIEQYTQMVLVYLRLDSDTSDYVLREQELDGILCACVKKFSTQFIRRHLRLTYAPVHTKVLTDGKWLSFVIEQLLSNAVKYTKTGGVEIFMAQPGVLCIRDSGVGIRPEDLPRIFERGYTGTNGRAEQRSSGIGLYLCKRVCHNLNHGLRVESVSGQGTAAYLDLRREKRTTE